MYRVQQFIWAILSYFKSIDKEFVKKYLNKEEELIFSKLSKGEQHHSIRVCKNAFIELESNSDNITNKEKLAKVALLHDIGKITYNLNVIEKSIIVLADKFSKGKIKKYDNIKQIDVYYNHPRIGANILNKFSNFDEEMINIIKSHHLSEKGLDNNLLSIIIKADNKS